MRIATWNVNGIRARLDFVLHWLRAREPDVVGLQELKVEDDGFPLDELAALGYRAVTHGQKAWNGVAVLTRGAAETVQLGLPSQEALGARLLTVRTGGLLFTSVYCPNGKHVEHEDYARKLLWFDALLDHLDRDHDAREPFVLAGDFNVCPTPLDSWNEEELAGRIFHTDEERRRLERLESWGLVDLWRRLHPERRMFSWWDYRGGAFHRNMGLRIDLLLATPTIADSAREAFIDRDYRKKKEGLTASDHAPVVVDLEPS